MPELSESVSKCGAITLGLDEDDDLREGGRKGGRERGRGG